MTRRQTEIRITLPREVEEQLVALASVRGLSLSAMGLTVLRWGLDAYAAADVDPETRSELTALHRRTIQENRDIHARDPEK